MGPPLRRRKMSVENLLEVTLKEEDDFLKELNEDFDSFTEDKKGKKKK